MGKRIPRTTFPSEVSVARDCGEFSQFCEVIVQDSPMIFTYAVPAGEKLFRGSVVWIQLSRRKPTLGVVSKLVSERPAFKNVKPAFSHKSGFVFGERFMEKLEWVSKYYMATPMQSLGVFLPKDFGAYLDAMLVSEALPEIKPNILLEKPALTDEQTAALERLSKLFFEREGFRGALLHGVTGSGKTRVYMELAARAIEARKKVLVLVPEIGLAPQTASRFSEFLGFRVPVLHSALSAPLKREAWKKILLEKTPILIGTRSAILSPFDYDLIFIDEEHDGSYKQEDSPPRYHARSLALHETFRFGAMIVLGSATPSLETFLAAKNGKLEYIPLTKRATSMALPLVKIVDMKKSRRQDSSLMLSIELREALTKTIREGNQAIVLMNRRGYSKTRTCSECGNAFECPECKVPLVYHKQYGGLLCHYCGRIFPLNTPCPECGSSEYEFSGGAIEKLEEEILEWIPEAKVVRMDRDTTANVGAAEKILSDFRERKFSILLGTQIVAKGHDFPDVQVVGVVGADIGAGVPDFRSGERLFELLSQTSGRAGRAKEGGQVVLQSNRPDDPIIRFATSHDFFGFAEKELAARLEANYPPYCKLASLEIGHKDPEFLEKMAQDFADRLAKNRGLEVLGPVDAFISQVRGTFWKNILLKAKSSGEIRKALAELPKELDIRIDIDPQ